MGQKVWWIHLSNSTTKIDFDDNFYVNFSSNFSLNGKYYDTERAADHGHRLHILLDKKIMSAKFVKDNKGDLKLTFDSGDELIIHEDDGPYESYTMQTPEGLVVV